MSVTNSLLVMVVENVVPFGDKLLPASAPKSNPRDVANRLKVAKSMQRAIRKGDLSESYGEAVEKMENNAKQKLSANTLENSNYFYEQVSKVSSALNLLIPGAGKCTDALAHLGKATALCQYADQTGDVRGTVIQVAKYAIPTVGSVLLVPAVVPLLTTTVVATGVGAVFGTALIADTFNYFRRKGA